MKRIAIVVITVGLGAFVAGAAEVKPRPARPIPEWAKQFDKNGDGLLDPQERQAATTFRRDQAMKPFDKNGDGKLDQEEAKARNEALRKEREATALAKQKAEADKKKDEKKEEKKEDKK